MVLETAQFYKALCVVNTDFSTMEAWFPGRSRWELKEKFKKEDKINRNLIDKALLEAHRYEDLSQFDEIFKVEGEVIYTLLN